MSDAATLQFTTSAEDRGAGATFDDLVGKLDGLVDALGRTGGPAADGAVNNLSRVGDVAGITNVAVGSLVADGLVSLGGALVGAASDSLTAAADFESGMNRFASVTGSSIADAGLTLGDFQNKFLELGAVTQFSAAQAQDAAIALAKGGVAIPDIMAGATQATLDLAAAGELELAPAADIVAKQLGVWGETGVTAAQVADSLAQAANASTVDVDELALGLANVGGSAKVAGVDFEDLVQTMALIAPGFSSAADAGTSLKTMIARLVPQTKEQSGAMRELGLLAFDQQGALDFLIKEGYYPAGTAIADLSDPLADLTEQFGYYIADTTEVAEGTAEMNKAVTDFMGAFESNVFYDAAGQFVGMEAAARSLHEATKDLSEEEKAMAFNTIFGADAIRAAAAVANAGAEGFNAMGASMANAGSAADQATQRNQGYTFAVDSLKGTLETLQIVVGSAVLPVLTALITDVVTPGANAFLSFAQAVLGASDPFTGFLSAVAPVAPMLAGLGASILVAVVPAFWAWATAASTTAAANIAALAPILVPIVAIGAAVGLLTAAWTNDWGGIASTTTAFWEGTGRPIFEQLQTWLSSTLTAATGTLSSMWTGTLQPALLSVWAFVQTSVVPTLTTLGTVTFAGLQVALGMLASSWTGTLQPALSAVWAFTETYITPVLSALGAVVLAALGLAVRTLAGYWTDTLQPALSAVWTFVDTQLSPALTFLAANAITPVGAAFSSLASLWSGTIQPALSPAVSFFRDTLGGAVNALRDAIQGVVDFLGRLADKINSLPSLPSVDVPGFATGVRNFRGGMALVGEQGPELVTLPRGSNVYTAGETRGMLGGGGGNASGPGGVTINQTFNIGAGTSDSDVRRIMAIAREEAQKVLREAGARGDIKQRMGGR